MTDDATQSSSSEKIRGKTLSIRLTQAEHDLVTDRAYGHGETVADLARRLLLDWSRETDPEFDPRLAVRTRRLVTRKYRGHAADQRELQRAFAEQEELQRAVTDEVVAALNELRGSVTPTSE